jgi:L,D-peptidoglycan transpeptidase YkuD (ErfK/YbiS/YcfS/YnhG family)
MVLTSDRRGPTAAAALLALCALLAGLLTATERANADAGRAGTAASDTARRGAATPWPLRVPSVGDARQVVIVTAATWTSTRGRLQLWQRDDYGTWTQVMAPVPARLGWSGFVKGQLRRQGSGKTPAGTFRLLRGFGLVDPGRTALPYRVVDGNDWWPYDPHDRATYNVMQWRRPSSARWRTSWAEDLDAYRPEYRYAVVLDYNLPTGVTRTRSGERVATKPADTALGGGIFLHVNGDGPTAGCVSVSAPDMRRIVRWLDPAAGPVIAMGPRTWLPGR